MKRLRLHFAAFFALLSITLGFLLWHTYRQIDLEERELWRGRAEKIYNQMQAVVGDFLTAEDRRALSEYRFQPMPLSPIAQIPSGDLRGLIGYFQIDPDGTFTTPYLPKNASPDAGGQVPDAEPRRKLQKELEEIAGSLKVEPGRLETAQAARPEERRAKAKSGGRRYVEPRLPDETLNLAVDVTGLNSVDPFQVSLINERYLLFHRKVWKDKTVTVQGFAVELRRFYDWLMERSFANSEFPGFALTRLEVADTPIAQYGLNHPDASRKPPFFVRALGYPLSRFEWKITVDRLPPVPTRLFMNVLAGALFALLTAGLYAIYRASASQAARFRKKQDLLSEMTRELKTSLASVKERGESGRLERLVENVLRIDRLEQKTYTLNLKKEHPSPDFKEAAEELKKMAERQGGSMAVEVGPQVPPIIYDPEAVKQILLTLLDQSLKFESPKSPESPKSHDQRLELSLVKEKDEVVFSFRDPRAGVTPGIGLTMARGLAQAMGAHVEARNREGRDRGGLEVRLVFKVFR